MIISTLTVEAGAREKAVVKVATFDDYLVKNDKFLTGVPEYEPTFVEKFN